MGSWGQGAVWMLWRVLIGEFVGQRVRGISAMAETVVSSEGDYGTKTFLVAGDAVQFGAVAVNVLTQFG